MKQIMKRALLCSVFIPCLSYAQEPEVDRELYPDYSAERYPDYSLLDNGNIGLLEAEEALPSHVNNAETPYFPPVFNQAGGSCSAASRIGYMFTHEMNSYRGVNGNLLVNRYPSHFVWLMTHGNSGKYALVQHVGVPSAAMYGGITYSRLFGNQTPTQNNFGWMQGYDKWYSAMFNRMLRPSHFPLSVKTEEGRLALKRWLYNHNGDPDFHSGGIAGVGVGVNGKWEKIPSTPANDECGATGQKFVRNWGIKFNHALTVVGYDDRIEFDLNNNGIYGEKSADEVGAWIIANSWGSGFCNKGFVYCPYAYGGKTFRKGEDGLYFSGHWWFPEVLKVRKNYRPLRTLKVKMDYSHRSEIALSVGIASNPNATTPEKIIPLQHFQYAGDGHRGKTNPAPAIPMLGKWADGTLHTEPMEFGYDLTDLSGYFDKNMPLKYFFIIETRDWGQGQGKLYQASIIDYEFDPEGSEVPFNISEDGLAINSKGNRTIVSTIVSGESYYEPQNLSINNDILSWQAPLASVHTIEGYRLYSDENLLTTIAATDHQYQLPTESNAITYSLSALYENNTESSRVTINAPVEEDAENSCLQMNHSGFSIPNVFNSKYDEATIEFWIRPHTLVDYNQGAGPGWDDAFKMHSNAIGSFVVGWDQENRINTVPGTLRCGQWTHIAVVVKHNNMTVYANGKNAGTYTTSTYSGIGGFEDFDFGSTDSENNIDADIEEFRIWNYARSAEQVDECKNTSYSGTVLPRGLMTYYKGTTLNMDNQVFLRDYAGVNHARMLNRDFLQMPTDSLSLQAPSGTLSIEILPPAGTVYAGLPSRFEATYAEVATQLCWNAEGAGINNLLVQSPSLTFKQSGKQTIEVVASSAKGETIKTSCEVEVTPAPEPQADFTISQNKIAANEHVTFIASKPLVGYIYEWNMPGSKVEKANTPNAATTYMEKGNYKVSLTVTSPNGKKATSEQQITVVDVAPKADFEVEPSLALKGEPIYLKDFTKYSPTHWQWTIHREGKDYIVEQQQAALTTLEPGVYDITLTVSNPAGEDQTTRKRGLTICNADSKNGLYFTSNDASVTLSKPIFDSTPAATIEWWMNPATLTASCNGFGQAGVFHLRTNEWGAMILTAGGQTYTTSGGFVKAGEWHHYAIVFDNGSLKFYCDGLLKATKTLINNTLPTINQFAMGGLSTPIDGEIDEFRIWLSALSKEEIQQYANSPITDVADAVTKHQLSVYYDFNQAGGDVVDHTDNHIDGIRHNFGPDGDAWGLSQGVFCLCFEKSLSGDVTSQYLKNYKMPFVHDGNKIINPTVPSRFYALADWNLENVTQQGNITTCVHADKEKSDCFTMTTGWDGFGDMKNHKAFQTMTLPAGSYTFISEYAPKGNAGISGESYLVAAQGKSLPDTENLDEALGASRLQPKSKQLKNTLQFVLREESEVSLGLVINMSGKLCSAFTGFQLFRNDVEYIKGEEIQSYNLQVGTDGHATLCLPYPAIVPAQVKAYTVSRITNGEAEAQALESGVIPANTGVIIVAKPGTYRFDATANQETVDNLLYGTLKEEQTDESKRYFKLDANHAPAFVPYEGKLLKANQAYLVCEASEAADLYPIHFVTTGIEGILNDNTTNVLYDLSGRRVQQAVKGLYISNGKKILVK